MTNVKAFTKLLYFINLFAPIILLKAVKRNLHVYTAYGVFSFQKKNIKLFVDIF